MVSVESQVVLDRYSHLVEDLVWEEVHTQVFMAVLVAALMGRVSLVLALLGKVILVVRVSLLVLAAAVLVHHLALALMEALVLHRR